MRSSDVPPSPFSISQMRAMCGMSDRCACRIRIGTERTSRFIEYSYCPQHIACRGKPPGLISGANRLPHSLFRRLGKLDGDKVFCGIQVVFARFINYANLVELGRGLVGNDLVELPQFE